MKLTIRQTIHSWDNNYGYFGEIELDRWGIISEGDIYDMEPIMERIEKEGLEVYIEKEYYADEKAVDPTLIEVKKYKLVENNV